jgi:hypothetical protein
MIKCEDCGAAQPAGTLYCSECGRFLLADPAQGQEAPLPFTDALERPHAPPLLGQALTPSDVASVMTVVIPSSGRRIQLELSQEIQVGRSDPANDHYPALDLTEDQGSTLGVSRVHASIQPSPEGVLLVDEGSANGTYLNGYHLPPQLPYPLRSGDEVRFGRLLVHVFLE